MTIAVERRADGRADVVIDRPAVRNALTLAGQRQLAQTVEELERDTRVRVIVLTGAGDRAFCAGADMKGDDESASYLQQRLPDGFAGISVRRSCPVPMIARVNGHAVGGGCEMVLGCHLAVMADHATLGLPEPLVGRLPLDGGVPLLLRALPRPLALELLLSGRRIDASEALALGLVNRVVSTADLDEAVEAMVAALLAAAPLSQRAILALACDGDGLSVRDAHACLPAEVQAVLESADGREGVAAFSERRAPRWSGR